MSKPNLAESGVLFPEENATEFSMIDGCISGCPIACLSDGCISGCSLSSCVCGCIISGMFG